MSDLFTGTADYYRRFRPPYPNDVIAWIIREHGLDGKGSLLDAGCGTGQVFSALASRFAHTIALDPDREMLASARQTALEQGLLEEITFVHGRVEDITQAVAPLRMAVFGSSFQWTDRIAVARLLNKVIEPKGAIVVLSPSSLWVQGAAGWKAIVMDTIRDWIGSERRAGSSGTYGNRPKHEECLKDTPFRALKEASFTQPHLWTADSIIGYLFSTSFASRSVLGVNADKFEFDLRARLRRFDPNGQFADAIELSVISARRE